MFSRVTSSPASSRLFRHRGVLPCFSGPASSARKCSERHSAVPPVLRCPQPASDFLAVNPSCSTLEKFVLANKTAKTRAFSDCLLQENSSLSSYFVSGPKNRSVRTARRGPKPATPVEPADPKAGTAGRGGRGIRQQSLGRCL